MTIYLQITSGRGPEECGWVVAQLFEALRRDAHAAGLTVETIDVVQAAKGAFRSVILALNGKKAEAFATPWLGVVQWIGASMLRPHHKRKNWFVGISRVELESGQAWNEADVRIEVMRASGPGGQHVNKTSSAVRVTHMPTGLSAISQNERSQSQNRKMALLRLRFRLRQKEEKAEGLARQQRWGLHNQLERGNPVRVYEGPDFHLVRKADDGLTA